MGSLPDREQVMQDAGWQNDSQRRSHWERVIDRMKYLLQAGPRELDSVERGRRLCITALAGCGKSICLRQLCLLRATRLPGQLVLHIEFGSRREDFPSSTRSTDFWAFLTNLVNEELEKHQLPPMDVQRWLKSLAETGKLTLAVDGLDELDVSSGNARAAAIAAFLRHCPQIHCVIAGRPYAIQEHYWELLFARDSITARAASDWVFCLVEVFTQAQRELFLGLKRLNYLKNLHTGGEFSVRTLEVLRTLTMEQVKSLRSLADVYWEGVSRSLPEDKHSSGRHYHTDMTTEQIFALLGAAAFLCVSQPVTSADNDSGPQVSKEMRLSNDVWDRLAKCLGPIFSEIGQAIRGEDTSRAREEVQARYAELHKLGTNFVEYAYLDLTELRLLKWRVTSQRDFFAALWLVRHASKKDLEWLMERQTRVGYGVKQRHSELQELWAFVCGMPDRAFEQQDSKFRRWGALAQSLFRPSDAAPRPTALMAISWPRLLLRAGFHFNPAWEDVDLRTATQQAQCEAERLWKAGRSDAQVADNCCRRVAVEFLSEYPRLRDGASDRWWQRWFRRFGSSRSRICNEDLESQWKSCDTAKEKKFWAGDGISFGSSPPEEKTLQRAFQLCAIPVTRRLYALFDGNHERDFDDYGKYSPELRCPAIYLSWWDAVMVSIWLHGGLLDEWEWEYACRGGKSHGGAKQDVWWWGDDESQLEKYAWIMLNSKVQTHEVGQKEANPYELLDMLGNVWEWTSSLWSESENRRVVRGGSFLLASDDARASIRFFYDPSGSGHGIGCRVARADF